jgi:predicted glycoside hydrolase/deacetylase ChbG (UPF0249 family)
MARIILNADDYGALSCIDDGIIEGIVPYYVLF